ncbi:MAG TPA: MarR family transcriptional regulator [Spirochaetia bacterium]|nr:MarR family transcriptional regulator [Spirochaetaceae bacterium]HPE89657.1 MarR family transcriptional regulator [Spirochaetales bacterium]HRW24594.1 MarR family transcriptional regulator [Spirochaetia bacterium]
MVGKEIGERHFIEDVALFCEQMGLPRMAGRVLGVLLISDPPSQSLNELCDCLQASKSSVSTMARLLVGEGLIEPAPCLVPRRDYFRFKDGGWLEFMRRRMEVMAGLHAIADRGLELLDGKDESLRTRLEEAHDVFEFVDSEFRGWLERMGKRSVKSASRDRN